MDWSSKTIILSLAWIERNQANATHPIDCDDIMEKAQFFSYHKKVFLQFTVIFEFLQKALNSNKFSKSKQWTARSQIGLLCRSLNQKSCSLKRKLNAETKGCWRTGLFELEVHLISPVFHLETAVPSSWSTLRLLSQTTGKEHKLSAPAKPEYSKPLQLQTLRNNIARTLNKQHKQNSSKRNNIYLSMYHDVS